MIYDEKILNLVDEPDFKYEYQKYKSFFCKKSDFASRCFIARLDNNTEEKNRLLSEADSKVKTYYECKNTESFTESMFYLSEIFMNFGERKELIKSLLKEVNDAENVYNCALLDAVGTAAYETGNIRLCSKIRIYFKQAVEKVAQSYAEMPIQELDKKLNHLTHLKNVVYEYSGEIFDISPLYEIAEYLVYLYNPKKSTFVGNSHFLPSSDFLAAVALSQSNPAKRTNQRERMAASYFIANEVYSYYGYYTLLTKNMIRKDYKLEEATLPYAAVLKNGYTIIGANRKESGTFLVLDLKNNSLGMIVNGEEFVKPQCGAQRRADGKFKIIKNEMSDDTHVFMYKNNLFTRFIASWNSYVTVIIDRGDIGKEILFEFEKNTDIYNDNDSDIVVKNDCGAVNIFGLGRLEIDDGICCGDETSDIMENSVIKWSCSNDNAAAAYVIAVGDTENIGMWDVNIQPNKIYINVPQQDKHIEIEIEKDYVGLIHQNGAYDRYLF